MKSATVLFLAGALWLAGLPQLVAIELDDIARQIEVAAKKGAGISKEEQKLSEEILELGAPAIPYLLPLLEHKNNDVRALTSFTLRDIKGLSEEHLDALIASRLKGDGWIPPAIARIGTPRAIKFLLIELKKEKQMHTQLTGAFNILGEKGIPYLVELFNPEYDENYSLDTQLLSVVGLILGELGDKARGAVDPLIEIASNEQLPDLNRRFAILALGNIGVAAHRSVSFLQALAAQGTPEIKEAVDTAIVNMGAPEAVDRLVKQLHEDPDILDFRDIAELRKNGKSAGSELLPYLQHKDWDVRVGAARALGYIGYELAIPSLIKLLENKDDWRLVYVAAESLGRIQAKGAVPALTKTSRDHWYPPVRDAAKKAAEVIKGNKTYDSKNAGSNFAMEFFDYVQAGWGLEKPSTIKRELQSDKNGIDSNGSLNTSELKMLVYQAEIHSYGPKGKEIRKRKQIPEAGVKVENGYIVGASRGEWGGELMYIDVNGSASKIVEDNIQGIYNTFAGIIAVAGLAHMGMNNGMLYKVSQAVDSTWHAAKWKALPGAPRSSALREDGSLFIGSSYGSVVLSPDGGIRMAGSGKSNE